jgi:hypothetical protein
VTSSVQRTTRKRTLAHSATIVGALALGLALAFGFHVVNDRDPDSTSAPANVRGALAHALASQGGASDESDSAVANATTDPAAAADAPDAAAPTPTDAVQRFLDFEIARDYDASYGLLSASDRAEAVTRAGWSASHADIPAFTGYALASPDVATDRAVVPGDVRLRAALTPSTGLVPARASAQFQAVAEDGGWRIAFDESTLTPRFLPQSKAPAAVRTWARTRMRCRGAREYVAGLIGASARADALCRADGAIRTGRVRRLPDTAQDQPFLAAFGGDVHEWARVVRLESPVRQDVVVAPVGEQWLVVGVLQAPSERS